MINKKACCPTIHTIIKQQAQTCLTNNKPSVIDRNHALISHPDE